MWPHPRNVSITIQYILESIDEKICNMLYYSLIIHLYTIFSSVFSAFNDLQCLVQVINAPIIFCSTKLNQNIMSYICSVGDVYNITGKPSSVTTDPKWTVLTEYVSTVLL